MCKESLLKIILDMQSKGRIKDVALSDQINLKLREGKIEEVYWLLDKSNMIIILRSIVREYLKLEKHCDLKLEEFDKIVRKKALEREMLICIYRESINLNLGEACILVCDLLHKQN